MKKTKITIIYVQMLHNIWLPNKKIDILVFIKAYFAEEGKPKHQESNKGTCDDLDEV